MDPTMDPAAAIAADWTDQQRQDTLMATSVVFTVMAALFVILRCISRFALIRNQGVDDYMIVAAMVLTIAYLIDLFVGRNNHMGFPIYMLSLDNMISIIKATLAIQVSYYGIIFFIKASILFTYLRFAVTRTFRVLCIVTIVVHSIFSFICVVTTLAQCRPLHKMWDMTKTVEGSCINTTAFFYFTSSFNIITDVWILLLPIKTLSTINRPKQEKIALFVIFGIGTFATICSIVRLHTIYTYTEATDPFRDALLVNLWSMIEVNVAIACASVPALKPIFSGAQRMRTRMAMSGSSRQLPGSHGQSAKSNSARSWHFRLGSKDFTSKSEKSQASSDYPIQGADDVHLPGGHHMPSPFPPAPAMPSMRSTNRMDEVSSTESVVGFTTPISPPPRGHQMHTGTGDVMDQGMDSSGPVLVLQK